MSESSEELPTTGAIELAAEVVEAVEFEDPETGAAEPEELLVEVAEVQVLAAIEMLDPAGDPATAFSEAEAADPDSDAEAEGATAAAPVEMAPDPVLLAARDVARAALAEITDPKTIGADEGYEVPEERVLSLFFECRLPGYPGWHWTATLSRLEGGDEVNVLEVELLPGPGSVVAPDWVPWSERLAQYREAQARQAADEASAAEAAAAELAEEDDIDVEDDLLENDFSDFDDEIDGVDVDDVDLDEFEAFGDDDDDEADDDDDDAEDDADAEDDGDDDEDAAEDVADESDDSNEEDSEDDDSEADDEDADADEAADDADTDDAGVDGSVDDSEE